jgi:hypothetical protein
VLDRELEVALRELTLDRPAPELIGELEDPGQLDPQLARNALKPRDLTPTARRSAAPSANDPAAGRTRHTTQAPRR